MPERFAQIWCLSKQFTQALRGFAGNEAERDQRDQGEPKFYAPVGDAEGDPERLSNVTFTSTLLRDGYNNVKI